MPLYKLIPIAIFSVLITLSSYVDGSCASITGVSPTGGNIQEVFFATDRISEKPKKLNNVRVEILKGLILRGLEGKKILLEANGTVKSIPQFGNRSVEVSYGRCLVTIPESHKIGEVERPFLDYMEDLSKDIGIIIAESQSDDEFYSKVNGGFKLDRKRAFMFVHGHNVSFDDAVERTAQIAHDLDFEGAPVLYSWPSKPCWLKFLGCGYERNEDMVEAKTTKEHFVKFLINFFNKSDADSVYIIAHSLGTRLVSQAVNEWSDKVNDKTRERLKEVILAASDLSADVFKTIIMPRLSKASASVTLYAAANDKALWASEEIVHDGETRVGQTINFDLPENIVQIDATNINVEGLGHAYATEKRSVISDIYYLIGDFESEKVEAQYRFGITKQSEKQGHWEFDR